MALAYPNENNKKPSQPGGQAAGTRGAYRPFLGTTMRLAEDTPDTLTLFTEPNRLVMLLGVIIITLATLVALIPAKAVTLTFTRQAAIATCTVAETRFLTHHVHARIPERLVKGAIVEAKRWGEGRGYARLHLDIADGRGPYYFAWYGNPDQAEAHAASINAYLEDRRIPTLEIINDKRRLYGAIAVFQAFWGLVFILWGSGRLRVTFSRAERQVRVVHSGLLGTKEQMIPMGEIKLLDVKGLMGDCQLYMRLVSGRTVLLSTSTDTEGLGSPRRVRESRLRDATRLREICGLPA